MRPAVVEDSGNLDHQWIFNVHPIHGTQAFFNFAFSEMQPPAFDTDKAAMTGF